MNTRRFRTLLVLASCWCVVEQNPLWAGDWPQFLGPQGNGHTEERLLTTNWTHHPPKRLWSVEMHDNGYASPIAAMGKVFIVDHAGEEDVVRALDLKSGMETWRFAYLARARDWYGHSRSTPVYNEGKLYTLSREGLLHCLEARQGVKLWSLNTTSVLSGQLAFYRMVSSPVVDEERLLICAGGKSGLAALNKSDGSVIWTSPQREPMGHATPVVASLEGTKQYLVFTGLNLLGVRGSDGRILWRYPWKTDEAMNAANPVLVGTNQVLIGSCDNGAALLRIGRDYRITELWRNRRLRVYFGTPLVYEGLVFAKDDSQNLVCLELATGKEKWRQPRYGSRWYDSGGLLMGDKILITNGRTGDLFLVAANGEQYTQLASLRSPAGPDCLPAPILSDGILVLRSRSRLAALELSPAPSSEVARFSE